MRGASQAYLLAAGEGRRAGGPKAWTEHEGKPLLERQVAFLTGLFDPADVAVTIQEGWRERCLRLHPGVRWVTEDPEATPLGALQALLRAVPMRGWAFVHHVDMPVWDKRLFELLDERAAGEAPPEAFVPAFEGRKGHPVLLAPSLGPLILALDPLGDRLDHFLRTRKEEIVETPFPQTLENWNLARLP